MADTGAAREVHDGRPIPGPFGATWHLPDGPLPYVEGRFVPGSIVFNSPLRGSDAGR